MKPGHRARAIGASSGAVALLTLVAALYVWNLARAPIYLAHDEIKFALQARSIALSGRDLNGELMPLYFAEPEFRAGRDPISIYATALVLRVLPLSEMAIRLPTALVGIVDVVLMFFLARRVFHSRWLGLLASCLLACTPAHFIHSRLGLDVLYPLPFVIGWLLCLVEYTEHQRERALLASTLLLGVGVYSYLACVVMMPIYFVFTCLMLRRQNRVRPYLVAAFGFGAPLLLLVLWQISHPSRYADILSAYRPLDAARGSAPADLHSVWQAVYLGIGARLGVYWNFFNPSFLFLSGDSSLINSTREVGVMLLPLVALVPLGLHRILTAKRSPFNQLLMWGLVSAPVAAVPMAVIEIRRALLILPFAILIATFGVESLVNGRQRWQQAAAVMLLLIVPFQFRGFLVDYFGQYRARSSVWFGGNIRGAVVEIIERTRATSAPVYLSLGIPYVDAYWTFYSLASGRDDLLPRAVYYDPGRPADQLVPPGTLLVNNAAEAPPVSNATGAWEMIGAAAEPDGTKSFALYQRR